jgi:hypothetical protein
MRKTVAVIMVVLLLIAVFVFVVGCTSKAPVPTTVDIKNQPTTTVVEIKNQSIATPVVNPDDIKAGTRPMLTSTGCKVLTEGGYYRKCNGVEQATAGAGY